LVGHLPEPVSGLKFSTRSERHAFISKILDENPMLKIVPEHMLMESSYDHYLAYGNWKAWTQDGVSQLRQMMQTLSHKRWVLIYDRIFRAIFMIDPYAKDLDMRKAGCLGLKAGFRTWVILLLIIQSVSYANMSKLTE
jgi:hypothetical protein